MRSVFFSSVFVMWINSCTCWVVNDINAKMLVKSLGIEKDYDDVKAASLQRQISFIFPGTKWCGAGSIAEDYNDLGTERETDMCCREHDNCPEVILGGDTKYNLTNPVFYSRLSCTCDDTFFSCLKVANTTTAKVIGNIYFNALQTMCYREDYPTLKCIKRGGWFKTKCLNYSYDTSSKKKHQWFDVEDF